MAGSVNKVILIGNLGKDPEIRRLDTNVVVANFSLVTSEIFMDKATGEKRETTDWHTVVCWRGLAEFAEKFIKKGMKLYVEGRLKTRSWQDKENNTHYTTEIFADNIQVLNWNNENTKPQEKTIYPKDTKPTEPTKITSIDAYNFEKDDDLPF